MVYYAAWSTAKFNSFTDGYHGLGSDSQAWDPSKNAEKLEKRPLKNWKLKKSNYLNDYSFE